MLEHLTSYLTTNDKPPVKKRNSSSSWCGRYHWLHQTVQQGMVQANWVIDQSSLSLWGPAVSSHPYFAINCTVLFKYIDWSILQTQYSTVLFHANKFSTHPIHSSSVMASSLSSARKPYITLTANVPLRLPHSLFEYTVKQFQNLCTSLGSQ